MLIKSILPSCCIAVLLLGSSQHQLTAKDLNSSASLADMSIEELMDITFITAVRHQQKKIDSPRAVTLITAKEIRERNYRSVPEALMESAGVWVQNTNYGGGSPIIRGMIGNQILILVDGIRLNNGIYRLGPNQYLNTIDINQVDRIEVVRGAGSVLYGSDALGGLVNVITKSCTPSPDSTEVHARVFGRFASADRSGVGRAEVSGSTRKLGFAGGVSLKSFGDLRAGGASGLQPWTGYGEKDGDVRLSWKLSERQSVAMAFQQVNQNRVPRTDKLAEGSELLYEWDPQRRQLAHVEYSVDRVASFIDSFQIGVSYHNQLEQINRITKADPDTRTTRRDKVQTSGLGVQLNTYLGERQHLTYGADLYSDWVISKRVDFDLKTGMQTEKSGAFADGATFTSLGIYLQDEIQLADRLALIVGSRFSLFKLNAVINDAGTGEINVRARPKALTGSAHGLYKISEHTSTFFGVAQGFRAPNVDDSTILGSFSSGFETPNPNLSPEKSLGYEAGIRTQHKGYSATVAYFYSCYRNLIRREPGLYLDLPFLDLNDDGVQNEGEEDIFQRTNIGEALVQGVEIAAQAQLFQNWEISANLNWTTGEDKINLDPLRRIPPLNGAGILRWNPGRRWWIEYYTLFSARQGRLAPGDIKDPRISADGTPGFLTFNVRGGINLGPHGRFIAVLENITNQRYRYHGSGIDAAGINLVLGLDLSF